MNWGDLAKQVIGLGAPILGTALGGPLGGAAGRILAQAVGATEVTPEAVAKALPLSDADTMARAETAWADAIRAEADAQRGFGGGNPGDDPRGTECRRCAAAVVASALRIRINFGMRGALGCSGS